MQAIRVHRHGGPEVLTFEELPDPIPAPGHAVVRPEACGINFIDVYHRTGLYQLPLPFIPGQEGAGTVVSVGLGVTQVKPGDCVAWSDVLGSYAELVSAPADRLIPIPTGLAAPEATALMLQGATAHYLACTTYPLKPGDTCLVHAAAGGTGLLLCQIAKRRGARVIATVSTEAKAALALEAGADHVIRYTEQDFVAETRRLTQGAGVQVVFDSVGRTTFEAGLDVLVPRGMMVLFGQSSGAVAPFNPALLAARGSLFLTRPKLGDHIRGREELLWRVGEVLSWAAEGWLKVRIGASWPLAEAARAHQSLEGRATTGKLLLLP
jgi:NADPH2:quinone reductase